MKQRTTNKRTWSFNVEALSLKNAREKKTAGGIKLRAPLFISVAINRITYLSTVSIISQSGSVFRRIKFIKVLHYMKKNVEIINFMLFIDFY